MQAPTKDITISVCYDGECHEIQTYTNEYRSLMMLIYDRIYTGSFGECLGMGKCGTCMVEIMGSKYELSCYERNENMTLLRNIKAKENIRLSCQLVIDEKMDGLVVKVLP
jgi:ferredoxin, 2Fe-2S